MTLVLVGIEWAAVPAPPVNQNIGMLDVLYGELGEADCRDCHDSGVPDRHHLLYSKPIPPSSSVPYRDTDRNGIPDATHGCLNCHRTASTVVRDCTVCHTNSPHHKTPAAMSGDCVSCHGDVVDNFNDGHYIPADAISPATPSSSGGDGLPLNSRGKGAGACDYCHDDDGLAVPFIRRNGDLHHVASAALSCVLCHEQHDPLSIRTCERCHGPDSLHSIQADSPAPGNRGTIVAGGELAGYGHVGRNNGPGDSDCWGCHGFASAAAPASGPVIPTVYNSDTAVICAGKDTTVVLNGAAFTHQQGGIVYESDIRLTAADGSAVTLEPDLVIDQGTLAVTIPGNTRPGNYNLQATKANFASNPVVISIVPVVRISRATYQGTVTILGSGFGGYAKGSATSVTATITTFSGRRTATRTVEGKIVSWTDAKIVADFGTLPVQVTVKSVFGSATCRVSRR